jgi:soluble lytic murein transglycosylase
MIRSLIFLCALFFQTTLAADSGQAYLARFMKFLEWNQHLPTQSDDEFTRFVDETSPLSQKLREKWLYQLAYNKDWKTFQQHYQTSKDLNLQCYAIMANYQLDHQKDAVLSAKALWTNEIREPPACTKLFAFLHQQHALSPELFQQRLYLALENQAYDLALRLLNQSSRLKNEARILSGIYQQPKRILSLSQSELHRAFYCYGLSRLTAVNLNAAVKIWQLPKSRHFLNYQQQQHVLALIALNKAMQGQADAARWFSQVQPAFYNDKLMDWQIRFSLKYHQWPRVQHLIEQSTAKDEPCWQYWLARALDAQGQQDKAHEIYQKLAKTRHYYGFLASRHLKQAYHFEDEPVIRQHPHLRAYQPLMAKVKTLYFSNQILQASRLVNDFVSELPKDDKSALIYWLAHDLQWHGKSIYLSSDNELNNQLSLRFPLAYHDTVSNFAKHYQIPQELVYAIIRQESGFRDDANSGVGAQGLMQLMPSTAKIISKQQKINYRDPKQLHNSNTNINLGVAYLDILAKRFRHHPILMAAAYNAGPRQVVYWLKNNPAQNIDIWIETLPWHETRNYLKNIIAFYAVYQYRMQEKPDLNPLLQRFYTESGS